MQNRGTEVAIRNPAGMMAFTEIQSMSKVFYDSGLFPDVKAVAQAVVKIAAGQELGFAPIYSLQKIYIVKGKTMVAAETMGAMVKRSGRYDYRVVTLTDTECVLMFTDNGKDFYESKFTMEDARRAELVKDDSGWKKWPRAMLMSKALSQGARIVCPHVIAGTYTPEDFGGMINPETEQLEGIVEDTPKNTNAAGTPIVPVEKAGTATSQNTPQNAQDGQQQAQGTPQVSNSVPNVGAGEPGLLQGQKPKATPKQQDALKAINRRLGDERFFQVVHECNVKSLDSATMDEASAIIGAASKVK